MARTSLKVTYVIKKGSLSGCDRQNRAALLYAEHTDLVDKIRNISGETFLPTTRYFTTLGKKYNFTGTQARRIINRGDRMGQVWGWYKHAETGFVKVLSERHTNRRPIPRDPYHCDTVVVNEKMLGVFYHLKLLKIPGREIYNILGMGAFQQQKYSSMINDTLGELKGFPKLNPTVRVNDFFISRDAALCKDKEKRKILMKTYKAASNLKVNSVYSAKVLASRNNLIGYNINPDTIGRGIFTPRGYVSKKFKLNK